MNCPKCGFVQEERADCKKCGVVFAKFLAFHAPESAPAFLTSDSAGAAGTSFGESSHSDASQLHEIKRSLHNLEQRFHELEFERAERRRLHGEMRALEEKLKEGLTLVTACQEEVELYTAKLAEIPSVPSLQDFSALEMQVHAMDFLPLQQRIERMEISIQGFMQEQQQRALPQEVVSRREERLDELEKRLDELSGSMRAMDFLPLQQRIERMETRIQGFMQEQQQRALPQEAVSRLEKRLDELEKRLDELSGSMRAMDFLPLQQRIERTENRIQGFMQEQQQRALPQEAVSRLEKRLDELQERVAEQSGSKGKVSGDDAFAQLDATLKAVAELKASLQNVTLRYTEIGELKKNHLVLHDMVESLQHAIDALKKDPSGGSAAKTAELEKEVSALKAEMRKTYERIEVLETHNAQSTTPVQAVTPQELASLREDLAAVRKRHEEERHRVLSRLEAFETNVGESFAAQAEYPGHLEALTAQVSLLDQQDQELSGTLSELSSAIRGIPQKTAELSKIVEQLGQEYLETRLQVHDLEEKINSVVKPASCADGPRPSGDMHVIRENLDEIRRFMASLSRKL